MKKKILLLVVQLGFCTAIFFVAAILVFFLRARKSNSFAMPNLLNKNYLDVHNELQTLDLRIKISRREYQDLSTGFILSQSIAAGVPIRSRDSLHLVVNQPQPFLVMPNLLKLSLEHARSIVQRLPSAGRVYSLNITSVGRLETRDYPHNTVIAQFPPRGELVSSEDKVYVLVANRGIKSKKNRQQSLRSRKNIYKLIGQNITVAAQYFHHADIDYRIRKFTLPPSSKHLGQIYNIIVGRNGLYLVDVYYQKPLGRYRSNYERVELVLAEQQGKCVVEQMPLTTENSDDELQPIFVTNRHRRNETVQFLFYRQGAVQIQANCGKQLVYENEIYPENLR